MLGPGAVPDFPAVEAALSLAERGRVGKRCRMLNGLWAWRGYGTLYIGRPRAAKGKPTARRKTLLIPGRSRFWAWSIKASLVAASLKEAAAAPPQVAFFDRAGLSGRRLWVGGIRPGLRIRLFGSGRSRKVQDVMVDAKLPRAERGTRPVVFAGDEPVWLAGLKRSDAAPITERTKKAIKLELFKHDR